MINFKNYFYGNFKSELELILRNSPSNIRSCPHCSVPPNRRALFSGKKFVKHEFLICWWGLTLLDQGLHRYFPENYTKWIESTGGYPVPVEYSGFGCVKVVPPKELLESFLRKKFDPMSDHVSNSLIYEFLNFFVPELEANFSSFTDLRHQEFLITISKDKEFGFYERLLMNQSLAS